MRRSWGRSLSSLVLLVVLSWSGTAWSWTLDGHRFIALHALTALPAPMWEAFMPHISVMIKGVMEPDLNRVDDHELHIIQLRAGTPPGSTAPRALKRFATKAEEMVRSGRGLDEVLFVLGQATHFVQDLNQPLHAAWGETATEHAEIEGQMMYRSWQLDHKYRGFKLVKKYSCFAYEIATASSEHARPLFFDRDIKRVTEIAWDQAVNDTANLWQSVFWHALGPEQARERYGIPAPIMEIGKGFFC